MIPDGRGKSWTSDRNEESSAVFAVWGAAVRVTIATRGFCSGGFRNADARATSLDSSEASACS